MNSNRCSWCDVNWPALPQYEDCPCCRERTSILSVRPSLSEEDAATRAAEHAFGWWLWENDRL